MKLLLFSFIFQLAISCGKTQNAKTVSLIKAIDSIEIANDTLSMQFSWKADIFAFVRGNSFQIFNFYKNSYLNYDFTNKRLKVVKIPFQNCDGAYIANDSTFVFLFKFERKVFICNSDFTHIDSIALVVPNIDSCEIYPITNSHLTQFVFADSFLYFYNTCCNMGMTTKQDFLDRDNEDVFNCYNIYTHMNIKYGGRLVTEKDKFYQEKYFTSPHGSGAIYSNSRQDTVFVVEKSKIVGLKLSTMQKEDFKEFPTEQFQNQERRRAHGVEANSYSNTYYNGTYYFRVKTIGTKAIVGDLRKRYEVKPFSVEIYDLKGQLLEELFFEGEQYIFSHFFSTIDGFVLSKNHISYQKGKIKFIKYVLF